VVPSVFLSYAREDDEFTARLGDGLSRVGVEVWLDVMSLRNRGLTFPDEIRKAIAAHDRVVLVVSSAALASANVEAEWRYAFATGKVVIPVLYYLPPGSKVRDALPRELSRMPAVDARNRSDEYALTEVLRHLCAPAPRLGPALYVPQLPPHYQPRALDSARLEAALGLDSLTRLTAASRERTLVMHGMGGVGKSVVAAAVARSIQVRRQFCAGVVWLELGRGADVLAGLRRVGAAVADDLRDYTRVEDTVTRLAGRIADEPILIVADNAWSDEDLEPFVNIMGPATYLLVTTRDSGLAMRLGAVPAAVEPLTQAESLQLLAGWVRTSADRLPLSARGVADECGGLPLALSIVGAMAGGGTPWDDIAEAIGDADLEFLARKMPDYPYPNLLRALQVGVDALAHSGDELERIAADCFRQLAAVRWDRPVPEAALISLWAGRMRLSNRRAREVVSMLVSKALLRAEGEAPDRRLTLHDLLHDLTRVGVDLEGEHAALLDAYEYRHPNAPFIDDDGYYLDHVVHHIRGARRRDTLHTVLDSETGAGTNAWWEVRLRHGQVSGYASDLRQAWADAQAEADITRLARYALMIGSIRSAIGEVPAKLAAVFLEYELWTPAQALAAAEWTAGGGRFDMLVAVIPFLAEPQRADVAKEAALLARREPEDAGRIRRLLELASVLDRPASLELVREALPPDTTPSRFVGPQLLLTAWRLDPRTDLLDAAIADGEAQLDEGAGWLALEFLAAEVPASHLPLVRSLVDRIPAAADRLRVLLALANRDDLCPADLLDAAERELCHVADANEALVLNAKITPLRAAPERALAARRVLAGTDQLRPHDWLIALLAVLPHLRKDDRAEAERRVLALLENADRELVKAVTADPACRRLRELAPEFLATAVEVALTSITSIEDRWTRTFTMGLLLRHMAPDRARAVAKDEARRILVIDDLEDRTSCVGVYAAHLDTAASEALTGRWLARLIERLPAADLAVHAVPLLATAAGDDIAAVQDAMRDEKKIWNPDLRPALFAAWARHGDWDAALAALNGASCYELECALERVSVEVPANIAEKMLEVALELRDPDLFIAAVPLIQRTPDEYRAFLFQAGLQAVEALDTPHDRLRAIARLAPLVPSDLLPHLADLVPTEGDGTDHDEAHLALARAWLAHGQYDTAKAEVWRMAYAEAMAEAMLGLADFGSAQDRATWLDIVEDLARRDLLRSSKVKLLVGVARRCDEPRRSRLLREAVVVAEKPTRREDFAETHAEVLIQVAEPQQGSERERLLLAAWEAATTGGSWRDIRTLSTLGPLLARLPRESLRPRWEHSLEVATRSRAAVLQELTALVPVVTTLGGPDAAATVLSAVEDVDRWWP